MEFNERIHAYIAAKYYVHLTERFGERGKKHSCMPPSIMLSREAGEWHNGPSGTGRS